MSELHSEHFNLCRICLTKPETNKHLKFFNIFMTVNEGKTLKEDMKDLLDLNVESNDQKPQIVCELCYISMFKYSEMKKKAAESEIVVDYLAKKKSYDPTCHGKNVCSNSDTLKVIISNTSETRQIERKRIRNKLYLESSDDNILDGRIDTSEPRYCYCDQVAFGTMIACDNKKCITEWFHYCCVGIEKTPRGKWYCLKCRNTVKKLKMSKKK